MIRENREELVFTTTYKTTLGVVVPHYNKPGGPTALLDWETSSTPLEAAANKTVWKP